MAIPHAASTAAYDDALDPSNLRGKLPPPARHVQLIVVGAGHAGLAAALEAARAGVQVMLVEEHPLDPALMGFDVPLRFGGRMDRSIEAKGRVLERLVETRPEIAEAFELGIDVQLAVSAWGLFPADTVGAMSVSALGLTDGTRSWLVGYDHIIVAAGARDLGMSFPGWDKSGVVGALGAEALIETYDAFTARTIVVLGGGPLALRACRGALAKGLTVAAVVDVDASAADHVEFDRLGIPVHAGYAVEAIADRIGEVAGVRLHRVEGGLPAATTAIDVACDTVCSAIGAVPALELLAAAGCATRFDPRLGGHCPVVDADMRTSFPTVLAAGDCTGVAGSAHLSSDTAARQGRIAARTVAVALGLVPRAATAEPALVAGDGRDQVDYWNRWLQASLRVSGWDTHICLCESVTRRELAEVLPPSYLRQTHGDAMCERSFAAVLAEPPVSQDRVKRLTRAGMGVCQGRRCRDQVALLLGAVSQAGVESMPLASYRPPVRPLPLSVLAPDDEPELIARTWVSWFSIGSQSTPHGNLVDGEDPALRGAANGDKNG